MIVLLPYDSKNAPESWASCRCLTFSQPCPPPRQYFVEVVLVFAVEDSSIPVVAFVVVGQLSIACRYQLIGEFRMPYELGHLVLNRHLHSDVVYVPGRAIGDLHERNVIIIGEERGWRLDGITLFGCRMGFIQSLRHSVHRLAGLSRIFLEGLFEGGSSSRAFPQNWHIENGFRPESRPHTGHFMLRTRARGYLTGSDT